MDGWAWDVLMGGSVFDRVTVARSDGRCSASIILLSRDTRRVCGDSTMAACGGSAPGVPVCGWYSLNDIPRPRSAKVWTGSGLTDTRFPDPTPVMSRLPTLLGLLRLRTMSAAVGPCVKGRSGSTAAADGGLRELQVPFG